MVVVYFFLLGSVFLVWLSYGQWLSAGQTFNVCFSGFLVIDKVGMLLSLLTCFVMFYIVCCNSCLSRKEFYVILLSQGFSVLTYLCGNVFFFWFFYEMSILLLLYLLVSSSPYPERYSAFWYFLFYLVFSGMPMLVVVSCMFYWWGQSNCTDWLFDGFEGSCGLLFFLGLLFVTKVPLFPFHAWLPVVHAEASSAVSVCLSGYIMKLGVLGLVRFCGSVYTSSDWVGVYCLVLLALALVFYTYSSCELDTKRWLAFLSVCHIVVVPFCLVVCDNDGCEVSFLYCLGHALSAGVAFLFFWFICEGVGSRCWFLVKNGLPSSILLLSVLIGVLCFCGSLPPCLQFFCEVAAMRSSLLMSVGLVLGLVLYLFFSALVPLVCAGYLLTRYREVVPALSLASFSWLVLFSLIFLNVYIFIVV